MKKRKAKLKNLCAWCHPGKKSPTGSHGICTKCSDKAMLAMANESESRPEDSNLVAVERLAKFMGWRINDHGVVHDDARNCIREPFTRLDDAMDVVETIRATEVDFTVHAPSWAAVVRLGGGNWQVKFDHVYAAANTFPEAVCMAALAYLDATEKK